MADSLFYKIKRRFFQKSGPRYLNQIFPNSDIGEHSYGGLDIIKFGDDTQFSMGRYCSIAANVKAVLGGGHRTDWATTYPFSDIDPSFAHIKGHPQSNGNIVIGNDVWIGRDTLILSGITIGDGAVVAARSVVTKDIPAYSIYAGQPAKKLRDRFDPQIADRLLALKWWDWPHARVRAAVPLMLNDDIIAFLDAAENGDI